MAQVYEVNGIEVFEAGLWNGEKYTEKDLDEMIKNFGVVDAPLKIGHDAKQKISGQPAVGWISRLYKKGKKLYADIKDIPKTVYELMKTNAYKKRSAEIFYGFKDGAGRLLNNVFAGVALLGAELPALNTLEDIVALYDLKGDGQMTKVAVFEIEEPKVEVAEEEVKEKDDADKPAEPADANTDADNVDTADTAVASGDTATEPAEKVEQSDEQVPDVVETAKTEEGTPAPVQDEQGVDKNEEAESEIERLKAEVATMKEELERKSKEEEELKVSEFVKSIEKKIPPALKGQLKEFMSSVDNSTKMSFSIDDKKKVEETQRACLMRLLSQMPDMSILNVYSRSNEAVDIQKDEKVIVMAKELQKQNAELSMKDAIVKVYDTHPELVTIARSIKE